MHNIHHCSRCHLSPGTVQHVVVLDCCAQNLGACSRSLRTCQPQISGKGDQPLQDNYADVSKAYKHNTRDMIVFVVDL